MILLFWWQKFKGKSLLSLQKKEAVACATLKFGKICYVACAINHAGKLICLHERDRVGLIDKPVYIFGSSLGKV